MEVERLYKDAITCSFFGEIKEEEMTDEIFAWLRLMIEDLIKVKYVKVFYTTSQTEFDFICESVVLYLQHKYPDVLLIKCASRGYEKTETDNRYNDVICCEYNDYYTLCTYVSENSAYVLIDEIRPTGVTSNDVIGRTIDGRENTLWHINLIPYIRKHTITIEEAKRQTVELLKMRKAKEEKKKLAESAAGVGCDH